MTEQSFEVLERSRPPAIAHAITCSLGTDLRFDRGAIERCCSSQLEELDVDLLTVLASVAFADRRSQRRGRRWARSISVSVPVHRPGTWDDASATLSSMLCEVSGDQWRFEFRRRQDDDELRQGFLPGLSQDFRGATVVPYSGGLDSFATLARHRRDKGATPVLLVHAKHGSRSLASVLAERDRSAPALAVPFTVSSGAHAEPTYRTRTFIFFSLAALAWRRTNASRIWIGESGLGCIGPALVPFGIEQPVRGCHPTFVGRIADFLAALWGVRPPFEFPHLWITKGESITELATAGVLSGWTRTHWCSRNIRRQHPSTSATHCGLCSGCIFRRQSILAAGLAEDPATYYSDVLNEAELPSDADRADREVANYATISIDELAAAVPLRSASVGDVAELAASLGRTRTDIASQVSRLLEAHAREWSSFVDALPAESWMRRILPSRERRV